MLIRKLYRFEAAHIVRGCSTRRCSHSIHGYLYRVEVVLAAQALDHGQMVYDFSLLKTDIRELIDGFDHALVMWSEDATDYREAMQQHSERWVLIPVSPSAEQFARLLFRLVDTALSLPTWPMAKPMCGCIRSSSMKRTPEAPNAFATMPKTFAWVGSIWTRSFFRPPLPANGATLT
ncbi:6-carboxytetrahydropterin synthase Queuosine biosynthesis QueD, PTPS-I [Candidatus Burkholderia humilis]|nr:6-carboxytetrahydropterin synthase Queuosine biosynthesis QueD, PTPS-I [Candidatus Burkholderia humilis]